MDIDLSVDNQGESIDLLMELMNKLNKDLPTLAGQGSLVDALNLLELQLAQATLHIQRTFVLVDAIAKFLEQQAAAQQAGFRKSGENFSGTATPVN